MAVSSTADYTSIGDIKQYWYENLAPNYFDFDDVNVYQSGIFGYVNEVMGNTTEDAFNGITVARREFYPITAQFTQSLYNMATLQSIDIPLTTPAQCKCALIIPQEEVINNSTVSNGVYTCVIDSCLKIFADNLQFMLDYPIKIISKKTDHWSHTIHYDVNYTNSLSNTTSGRYLSNKIMHEDGIDYLIIFIDVIRQVVMEETSQVLVRDSILSTTTLDIDFTGNLANFEVFYKENGNDTETQLAKVLINGATPSVPFVFYEYVNENKIRLTFKYNGTFVPKYNSEIIVRTYTSEGSGGNFTSFDGDLICSSESENYPYNANMTILGKVNGSAYNGSDTPGIESLRNTIIKAYATNDTITTSTDLQLKFDEVSNSLDGVKVLFRKKRDDPFIRLFGAYALIKDSGGNVIPTNTLDVEIIKSSITDIEESENRIMIKPGTIFTYKDASYKAEIMEDADGNAVNLLDIDSNSNAYMFTNPFLIGINIDPNVVGYYMNTVNSTHAVSYTYVNDDSPIQFITSNFKVYRNAMLRQNYYKFSIKLSPATDIDQTRIVTLPDETAEDYQIRAKYNGTVRSMKYVFDEALDRGYVQATIEYDTDDTDEKVVAIQASSTVALDGESTPGYTMLFNVGESFIANDIIATKMPTDLGVLRAIADINSMLQMNGYQIPFVIEGYDSTLQAYELNAYLATDDYIDLEGQIVLTHGVFDSSGVENTFLPIKMKDLTVEVNVLYDNDGSNLAHKYSTFSGYNNFTMTNTYETDPDELVYFIEDLSYIRSVIDYLPGRSDSNYIITISEMPVVQATWAIDADHLEAFIQQYHSLDLLLQDVYVDLENNFTIDTKLYNAYGKSQFYTVGNNSEDLQSLDNVMISMRFGVKLSTNYNAEDFISRFRTYVKEYIEDTNNLGTVSQDIYINNLMSELKSEFSEIQYLEYYGFNTYDYMAQKIIGPGLDDYIDGYIPEFVNIATAYDKTGTAYPDITVDILG